MGIVLTTGYATRTTNGFLTHSTLAAGNYYLSYVEFNISSNNAPVATAYMEIDIFSGAILVTTYILFQTLNGVQFFDYVPKYISYGEPLILTRGNNLTVQTFTAGWGGASQAQCYYNVVGGIL